MTSRNPEGASEDVNDFLLRIRELGERRDKEDEARTKKLEQEILQGRKEREARRAGNIAPPFCFDDSRGGTCTVVDSKLIYSGDWQSEPGQSPHLKIHPR